MEEKLAYLKLQGINNNTTFIRMLPSLLVLKSKTQENNINVIDEFQKNMISLGKCKFMQNYLSIKVMVSLSTPNVNSYKLVGYIGYNSKTEKFCLIPLTKMFVDDKECNYLPEPYNYDDFLNMSLSFSNNLLQKHDQLESELIELSNLQKIYIPCSGCEIPHIFYFLFPNLTKEVTPNKTTSSTNKIISIFNPIKQGKRIRQSPDTELAKKWTQDEREQLKKFLLLYGYGRWKQIQKASKQLGGKLAEKPKVELIAFANALINSIIDNLNYEQQQLKQFLENLLDERKEVPYLLPNFSKISLMLSKQSGMGFFITAFTGDPMGEEIAVASQNQGLHKKIQRRAVKNILKNLMEQHAQLFANRIVTRANPILMVDKKT